MATSEVTRSREAVEDAAEVRKNTGHEVLQRDPSWSTFVLLASALGVLTLYLKTHGWSWKPH